MLDAVALADALSVYAGLGAATVTFAAVIGIGVDVDTSVGAIFITLITDAVAVAAVSVIATFTSLGSMRELIVSLFRVADAAGIIVGGFTRSVAIPVDETGASADVVQDIAAVLFRACSAVDGSGVGPLGA